MRNFKDTFERLKRSFVSAFSICMTVPLSIAKIWYINLDKALLALLTPFAPTTVEFNIFILKFSTRFLLNHVYLGVFGEFFTLFNSSFINVNVRNLVSVSE